MDNLWIIYGIFRDCPDWGLIWPLGGIPSHNFLFFCGSFTIESRGCSDSNILKRGFLGNTMSTISALRWDRSHFRSPCRGLVLKNTLEFLSWDDIWWSRPCFVQCVKDVMRIWYDMIVWWYDDMMRFFTSTMLGLTDPWPSWLAMKQTDSLRWKIDENP